MSNHETYTHTVINPGDEASGNFKTQCDIANSLTTIQEFFVQEGTTWKLSAQTGYEVTNTIDGVGTKTEIYFNRLNEIISQGEKNIRNKDSILQESIEICHRMLQDLISMNIDDLRNGEMGVAWTNIIDINHLSGTKGTIFSQAMGEAFKKAITENDLLMIAGETAIIGNSQQEEQLSHFISTIGKHTHNILCSDNSDIKLIQKIIQGFTEAKNNEIQKIKAHFGGTGIGIKNSNKFVPIRAGQSIIYFQEKPTQNGILGPRSNGITIIRKEMKKIAGIGWENLTFEEFIEHIGSTKANKLNATIKQECKGLYMWDIATGKSTVFNPFISRVLLGGIHNQPIVKISSLIHVTGNPNKKIQEGLKENSNLEVNINTSKVKKPQIIEIIQKLGNINDEQAKESWNMGTPYMIICDTNDVETIIQKAKENGIEAQKIGDVQNKKAPIK